MPAAHLVPAHVGDLGARVAGAEAPHAAREETQQADAAILLGRLEEDLGAEADAEEGGAGGDGLADGAVESRDPQGPHGAAGGADAGEEHPLGGAEARGVGGDLANRAERLERELDAGEVAGLVVDDGDHGTARVRGCKRKAGARRAPASCLAGGPPGIRVGGRPYLMVTSLPAAAER